MLREDATSLEGLPGPIVDLDVSPDGSWVAVCEREDQYCLASPAGEFALPEILRFPMIRSMGYDRFLLADHRTSKDRDNAWILSADGDVLTSFCAGDGIADVLVSSSKIVVTYFDQGVLGKVLPSQYGLCVFSSDGQFELGYASLPDAVTVLDCYCACLAGPNEVCFSPYTKFPLVRLNLKTLHQTVLELPQVLAGAAALTTNGIVFYFYSPYEARHTVFAWQPYEKPRALAKHPGPLRGFGRESFLSIGDFGYTVVYPEPR